MHANPQHLTISQLQVLWVAAAVNLRRLMALMAEGSVPKPAVQAAQTRMDAGVASYIALEDTAKPAKRRLQLVRYIYQSPRQLLRAPLSTPVAAIATYS